MLGSTICPLMCGNAPGNVSPSPSTNSHEEAFSVGAQQRILIGEDGTSPSQNALLPPALSSPKIFERPSDAIKAALAKRRSEDMQAGESAKKLRSDEGKSPSFVSPTRVPTEPGSISQLIRAKAGANRTASPISNFSGSRNAESLARQNLLLNDFYRREQVDQQNQIAANSGFSVIGRSSLESILASTPSSIMTMGSLQRQGLDASSQMLVAIRSLAEMNTLRQSSGLTIAQPTPALSPLFTSAPTAPDRMSALLRQISGANGGLHDDGATVTRRTVLPPAVPSNCTVPLRSLELPSCDEGQIEPYTCRACFPLGIKEDPNWLSEFHCFVRLEMIEVFRASHDDVRVRNNAISYQQIGIRCRFCAHMTSSSRTGRSCAFPSSLRQIYQSFTMMLRDHFNNCEAIPAAVREKFALLKDKPAQGATDSKRYWIYSAMKIGITDSSSGMMINERTRAVGANSAPFGTPPGRPWEDDDFKQIPLVMPSDRELVSDFLFIILSQAQPIRLTETERVGNRRSLRLGLPGFGCRYCCQQRRLGLCRMFPARRRTLPSKIKDLYDHLRRCTLCPDAVKQLLESNKHEMNVGYNSDQGRDRDFFDLVWSRLGHNGPTPRVM